MINKNEAIILRLTMKYNGEKDYVGMDRAARNNGWTPTEAEHVFYQSEILIGKGYMRTEATEINGFTHWLYWITDLGIKALKEYDKAQEEEKRSG